MKKLAMFVEGQTEQLFAEKLLIEIAGEKNIQFARKKAVGDILIQESVSAPKPEQKYYALLVNCNTDNRVTSDIREQYSSLIKQDYSSIVGLRDAYPAKHSDIPKLQQSLYLYVKTKPIKPDIILSIMEIEAWFLAEHNHFKKIDKNLTISKIKSAFSFDPSTDDMEMREHPTADLHAIYQLSRKAYTKKRKNCLRTINSLDYDYMYLELVKKIAPLKQLATAIDNFLTI